MKREVKKMLAYKEKEKPTVKNINRVTNIKHRTKKQLKNKVLGSMLVALALISLLIPETQEDGTAFVILLFMGITAIFSK